MNRLVCFVAVVGVVSAQHWGGNQDRDSWRDDGHRQPVVPAPLAHDGRVIDTPEIAQAKAAHFAAHDRALKANPPQPYNSDYREPDYNRADEYERRQEYRAPQQYRDQQENRGPQQFSDQEYRSPQYFRDQQGGRAAQQNNEDYDNYEVKAEPRWRGPLAKIEFTNDGKFIKDTPEVAHARAEHLAALQAARKSVHFVEDQGRHGGEQNNNYDDGQYRGDGAQQQGYRNEGKSWQGNQGNQYNAGNNYDSYDNGIRGEQGGQKSWQGPGIHRTQNTYY